MIHQRIEFLKCFHTSFVLSTQLCMCVLQVIGVVVADTHENAKLAATKVVIEYEELPAILSTQEAVDAKSFHPNSEKCLKKGDVDLCFQSGQCDKIIDGEVHLGGQEHFYLEPQSSLVWTMDSDSEVHMISSTQVS
ncbi:hypothetical protein OIU76_008172 [Salix suchowensis]|nr:hypothetical protein OIU76_008172 [Salix suchowensis]